MERLYKIHLNKYLDKKILILSGPRQSGKTTLSKMLPYTYDYLNYDSEEDRLILKNKLWNREKNLIIFDELHKMPLWKSWIKGVYDTEGTNPSLLVTGSARLDSYRKVGDSLAGRYFHYRLHPLDVREILSLDKTLNSHTIVERLLNFGGFPEPYLEGTKEFYNLWKKTHLDIILRQDLLDLEVISNIKRIELLVSLLQQRVGSPISYRSLAEDLQVSDKTIKRWLGLLEDLYLIFKITPYSKNIARSLLKKPKYYFYDNARVKNPGARLENLVATSLIKEVHFRQDTRGEDWNLYYLRKKSGEEIDFLIEKDQQDFTMVEVKTSHQEASPHFKSFEKSFSHKIKKVQLHKKIKREATYPDGTEIRELGDWLTKW